MSKMVPVLSKPVAGHHCPGDGEIEMDPYFSSRLPGTQSPTGLQIRLTPGSPCSHITSSLGCCSLVSPHSQMLVLRLLSFRVLCCVHALDAVPHPPYRVTVFVFFPWSFHCSFPPISSLRLHSLHSFFNYYLPLA